MIQLAAETEACLEAAGWTRDRRWNGLRSAQSQVQLHGHRMSKAATDFLSEFGGLLVRHRSVGGGESATAFDPIKAAAELDLGWLRDYEGRVGAQLSVVGQAYNGYMSVLVGDDGRVFLAYDDEFQCIGDDRHDALNSLCVGPTYNVERARRHLTRQG
jgi:hypothetical protein